MRADGTINDNLKRKWSKQCEGGRKQVKHQNPHNVGPIGTRLPQQPVRKPNVSVLGTVHFHVPEPAIRLPQNPQRPTSGLPRQR